MTKRQHRRDLKLTAAASTGFYTSGVELKASTSANEVIRWACVGAGGKGTSDSNDAARHGEIVISVILTTATLIKLQTNGLAKGFILS